MGPKRLHKTVVNCLFMFQSLVLLCYLYFFPYNSRNKLRSSSRIRKNFKQLLNLNYFGNSF